MRDIRTVRFAQSGKVDETFHPLEDAISMAPVLALPEEQGECMLHSDASKNAVRAVLSQMRQGGETSMIAFWSRKMKSAEAEYPTYNR